MGGSMKENMYKGGPWALEEILRKGLAETCLLPQVAAVTSVALVPDPWVQLEPKCNSRQPCLMVSLHRFKE